MKIGSKTLGEIPYIIAEFGVNHGNSLEVAKQGVEAAAKAGADAIKFQTYTADELVCKGTPKFWEHESADGKDQYQAYQELGGFPYEWYPELIKHCQDHNIEFLSTPFSTEAADRLNDLGMAAFKIASSDMSYIPLLKHIARFGKPILLSTGASTILEIRDSIEAILEEGNDQIIIMHCTLAYPTKPEDANLSTIPVLRAMYPSLQVGISDHTLGLTAPTIASYLGANVFEKHFTTDKTQVNTADHWLSVDPIELSELVKVVNEAKLVGGIPRVHYYPCEERTRRYDKRSIVSKSFIPRGATITGEMLAYKRPGTGLWPKHLDIVIGAVAKRAIPSDVPITFGMV